MIFEVGCNERFSSEMTVCKNADLKPLDEEVSVNKGEYGKYL